MTNAAPLLRSLSLVVIACCGTLPGQSFNEMVRFGNIDMIQGQNHPSTGYALELPGVSPPEFTATSTVGVPAGTLTWIWYPSQLNTRYEDRFVTGHIIATRPSSSTPAADYTKTHSGQTQKGVPQYIPRFSIYVAKARPKPTPVPAFGAGFEPDFSKAPLFAYTTKHAVLETQPDVTRLWTVTYNQRVRIPGSRTGGPNTEMILAYEWQGGEHWTKPRTQSIPTGWSEKHFKPSHWGWATAKTPRTTTFFDSKKIIPGQNLDIYSSPFGGYFEDEATLSMHSDWGELRDSSLQNQVYQSYNPGSGLSDVAGSNAMFNWDVFTDPGNRGKRALPLLNLRIGVQSSGTPFLGRMLEIDPFDPFLAALWGSPLVDGIIDNQGTWLPPRRIPVKALGSSAIGTWVGMESAVIDISNGGVVETTNAYWFYIEK